MSLFVLERSDCQAGVPKAQAGHNAGSLAGKVDEFHKRSSGESW